MSEKIDFILNGDYKILLEYLKDNKIKVDAVITDPPYNISRKNNFKSIGRSGIDFGEWDKNFDQSEWINLTSPFIKNGGSIIIFNDWKNLGEIARTLELNGFLVKDLIRWVKKNPMPRNTKRRYVSDFEFALWAVKPGKKWTFNFELKKDKAYIKPEYVYSSELGSAKRLHPTQKPLNLIIDLIELHTNPNDLVLDLFMGSGTTAIAALKTKRRFIGSEIDEGYYKKIMERLKNFKNE
ncbi:site-specific DNA-methyltransferase [Mesomycoplasma ovipneumoniae]|uniref:DNA-methyltransferase n=1 Tax=Mesomycoplasma ovipneumoniae TaxID=29562 RepID=UPI0026E28449|nr:site-specific DNA-methyltransferase [Mesomycoplasma ovipneumoniae]MDO6830031.1 site-specific DNA-methyltransferase [Mesomycoplasma ovipneumoniae]MDO6857304.1 site-specific DNA-methyltransferase [Mesomycoplasma ovipneumoniae]